MELKLVTEIKERADSKTRRDSPSFEHKPSTTEALITMDPAVQLVTELSEAMEKKEPETSITRNTNTNSPMMSPVDFKATLRKVSRNTDPPKSNTTTNENKGFKVQLKKTERPDIEITGSIIDFKAMLRKVDKSEPDKKKDDEENEEKTEKSEDTSDINDEIEENLKRDIGIEPSLGDGDDKRRSTGSISSLKKLWESKEEQHNSNSGCIGGIPLGAESISTAGTSPESNNKPAVPNKPPLKSLKPSKVLSTAAIYATPSPAAAAVATSARSSSGNQNSADRESVLEISQALETSLSLLRTPVIKLFY